MSSGAPTSPVCSLNVFASCASIGFTVSCAHRLPHTTNPCQTHFKKKVRGKARLSRCAMLLCVLSSFPENSVAHTRDGRTHARGKQEAHANRRVQTAACGADGRTDHILSIVKAVDKDSTLEMIILVLKPVSSPSMPHVCRISVSEHRISVSEHTTCVAPL